MSPRKKRRLAWLKVITPVALVGLGAGITTTYQLAHLGVFWLVSGSALLALCLTFLIAVWTDIKRRRLQNMSISFAALIGLLLGAFIYHGFFDPTAEAARAPKAPIAAIISPRSGTRLVPGQNVMITGTAQHIPVGDVLWLITDDGDSYTARIELSVTPQGAWKTYVTLAQPKEQAGEEHDVLIVLARDAQTEAAISEQYWDLGGIEQLSPDVILPNTLSRRAFFTG
jgi:hypothetical protein